MEKSLKKTNKTAKDFGKKEKVLNYTCQTYHLSRPKSVGTVMQLIRECQPKTLTEWKDWYFLKAYTKTKLPAKVTPEILDELGTRLYAKIIEIVIPEWTTAFQELTEQDCKDYIYDVTINRTFDGYIREKSIINDGLAKIFPELLFEESDPDLDHAGDIDYIARINKKAFGIQIKPITANANFGGYSLTERMKSSFKDFENQYGGKVFIVYSLDGEIGNDEVIEKIRLEIERLKGS